MLQLPIRCRLARRIAGLALAAAGTLLSPSASAQTGAKIIEVPEFTGAIAPPSEADVKNAPKRFSPLPARAQLGPPQNFAPPPSAAGATGFDSTNTRKRSVKPKTKRGATQPSAAGNTQQLQRPADSRTKAFASGQPGTPPVAFGPIVPPPKKRRPRDDSNAFDPIGVRAGGFLLYPALELSAGYDSNPGRTPSGEGAGVYTVAPELRAQSDWSRHELKANLRGSYSAFNPDTTPSLSRPYFNGKVDGRVDVTRNTRIDLGTRALVSTDNPNSPNLQAGLSRLPVYTSFGGNGGVTHRFNRLEVGIKGDAERNVYQDSKLIDGTTASNEDRNYNQFGGTLRAGYEIYPGFVPFIEGGGDTRKHDLDVDAFGFRRDSDGVTVKAGTTFEISRLLTGEFAVGYTRRKYEDERLEELRGIIGSGSLIWTASALTTVKLTAASSVGESTQPGVSGVLYRDAGLQVDHALRRWLILSLKGGFGFDKYEGDSREDKRFSIGGGLTYKLNRNVQLKGEVRRDWLRSNETGNDYTANIFLIGLRLQL